MEKVDKVDTNKTQMSIFVGDFGENGENGEKSPKNGPAERFGADDAEGDTWITREEASRVSGKSLRTIDRLRARGVLEDVPGPGVRLTKESLERYLRRKLTPRPAKAMTTVEADHYDGLLLQLQRKQKMIDELSGRLLTWEGQEAARAAELEAEREKAAALAAELEAERTRAREEHDKTVQEAKQIVDRERAKAAEIAAELEAERNKGFWARVFGKKG